MSKDINSIMLVDDNRIDNFFHVRVVKKYSSTIQIIVKESAEEAISYLHGCAASATPGVIVLDINMPGMSGWEFMEQYQQLDRVVHNSKFIIMTSDGPDAGQHAATGGLVVIYHPKPLTIAMLQELAEKD